MVLPSCRDQQHQFLLSARRAARGNTEGHRRLVVSVSLGYRNGGTQNLVLSLSAVARVVKADFHPYWCCSRPVHHRHSRGILVFLDCRVCSAHGSHTLKCHEFARTTYLPKKKTETHVMCGDGDKMPSVDPCQEIPRFQIPLNVLQS